MVPRQRISVETLLSVYGPCVSGLSAGIFSVLKWCRPWWYGGFPATVLKPPVVGLNRLPVVGLNHFPVVGLKRLPVVDLMQHGPRDSVVKCPVRVESPAACWSGAFRVVVWWISRCGPEAFPVVVLKRFPVVGLKHLPVVGLKRLPVVGLKRLPVEGLKQHGPRDGVAKCPVWVGVRAEVLFFASGEFGQRFWWLLTAFSSL